jgi:hypothetical protein
MKKIITPPCIPIPNGFNENGNDLMRSPSLDELIENGDRTSLDLPLQAKKGRGPGRR